MNVRPRLTRITLLAVVATPLIVAGSVALDEPRAGLLFLLIVPIAAIAHELGTRSGLVAAAALTLLVVGLDEVALDMGIGPLGEAIRGAVYVFTALLVGALSRGMRTSNLMLRAQAQDEHELSSTVLETVGALVMLLDRDGLIVTFNRACERVSGYSFDEVRGRHVADTLMDPSRVEEIKTLIAGFRLNEFPEAYESEWVTRDGSRRLITWSNAVLPDGEGGVRYIVATGIDITERATAEHAEAVGRARHEAFFDAAPALLFWKDADSRFVAVNQQFADSMGLPREQIVGRQSEDIFPPELAGQFREIERHILATGEQTHSEETLPTPGGQSHTRTVAFPLTDPDGNAYGIGGIATDVTDLVQAKDEIAHSQRETVARLARAVEFKDEDTGDHIERMSAYCELIAERLGLPDERRELIRLASPMHDAGKIAVPDGILLKPGRLDPEEREIMERHAEVGWRLLSGSTSELLGLAAEIAYTHHERFDGAGYPRGLAAEEIPLEGRIAAVADVFDALSSDRVYRDAMPIDEALTIMRDGRGSHFDPEVLDAFLDAIDDVLEIRAATSPALEAVDAGAAATRPGG
jgi:putative two-component system response regulator